MAKIFPNLTIPGFLLEKSDLEDLINRAIEVLEELDFPDPELANFIEKACALRAIHDNPIGTL